MRATHDAKEDYIWLRTYGTITEEMAEAHSELVVTFLQGMIKVGRWANKHKHAAVPRAGGDGLINERWAKVTGEKLPEASAARLG